MSDGQSHDTSDATKIFCHINTFLINAQNSYLDLHVIAFGGVNSQKLNKIVGASSKVKIHSSAETSDLSQTFVDIAGGEEITDFIEIDTDKQVSEAVAGHLAIEYLA